MKKILMKREIERFLKDHNYILSDNMFWKKYGHIHIDFWDEEGELCLYNHSAPVIEVTRTDLIVYDDDQEILDDAEILEDDSMICEIFRVQLDKIRGMKLTVKEVVEDE